MRIRITCAVLSALLLNSLAGINASAESSSVYSGKCSETITWTYNDETRTMVFSGTGKMPDNVNTDEIPEWKTLDVPYRAVNVVFEDGITGADWFDGYFCDAETFGDEKGTLTVADSVSVDNTFWQLLHSSGVYDKLTFKGEYGSSLWYLAPYERFIGSGYSESPVITVLSINNSGTEWNYTYENAAIRISGNGVAHCSDFARMPYMKSRYVVLGKDVKLPADDTEKVSLFGFFFEEAAGRRGSREIFIYEDSPALEGYNEAMKVLESDGISDPASKHPYRLITRDVNGDGRTDCSDASELLSEYSRKAAGIESESDAEKDILYDLNCDGTVNIEDASYILKYYAESAAGLR